MLDFSEGVEVFKELVYMGIIIKYWLEDDSDDEKNFIGEIDKRRLKEYLQN